MIKKIYRLKEKEVKKVLQKGKPFFSYNIVSNTLSNTLWFNRFAIIIWWKSVKNNVTRVFFRRLFYNLVVDKCVSQEWWKDIIFAVKKSLKLDKTNPEIIDIFKKDINFLIYKNNI